MATQTITKTCKVNGVLTDPESIVLSDKTGSFGVRRDDNFASVVAADTTMTKVGTGIYQYTFTEPAADLSYTYWVTWTYGGNTYYDEHTLGDSPEDDLATSRPTDKYLTWIAQEFEPLTLATPTDSLEQLLENAIRYWNTHSAYKVATMVSYSRGDARVQLTPEIKQPTTVLPNATTSWIWADHPLWTLTGVTVLDNVTTDLILLSEAFRNYRQFVATDFRWTYVPSQDPQIGGYLYARNIPGNVDMLYVEGTKRITKDENIRSEYILDWVLNYWKALVKQIEGNTLRKSSIINVSNDGQDLVNEGKEEAKELKASLERDSRWVILAKRT